MTDSEKLLAIVDKCKELRKSTTADARLELQTHGWQSELGYYQTGFDICGAILAIAGHADELDWKRDVFGVEAREGAGS